MDITLISLIVSVATVLVLIGINIFLLVRFNQTNKKIDKLLEGGKIKDFKDIFLSQKDKNNDLEMQIKHAFAKIKNLEDISETTVRKIGVVRFNPFNDMGGNQSFVIAMLDNKNNGFIISSIFAKEGSRVYSKTVKDGKSEYILSKDEVEAIEKAINFK